MENKKIWVEKVRTILEMGGKSQKTFINYKSHIKRFLDYYPEDTNFESILEDETGGGIKNNKWVQTDKDYLMKVQVLSSLFKCKFLSMLKSIDLTLPKHLEHLKDYKELNNFLRPLYNKDWVTYIEPPKGSPENVIEYIGRYSFRVAISNDRIKSIDNGLITFEYKDYKDNSIRKEMTITAEEFIRRFLLHVLPNHFTKIKHYGLLTNRNKKSLIKLCRILIGQSMFSDFSITITRKLFKFSCPKCGCTDFSYNYCYNFYRSCKNHL